MARIRSIKPEFPHDETLGSVSRDARLLFILLWTCADDAGRFRASPAYLRGQLFPFDDDATPAMVEAWLKELESIGRVRIYRTNAETYGAVTNWARHQRVDNASRRTCPIPPWETDDPGDPPPPADSHGEPPSEAKPEEDPSISSLPTPAEARGEIRLDRDRDRDRDREPFSNQPFTYTQPETSAEGSSHLQEPRVRQAAAALARHDLEQAIERGNQIHDERAWLRTATERRLTTDGEKLERLHAEHPDWMPKRLATSLSNLFPAYKEFVPEGVGNGAVKKNEKEAP